MEAFFLKLVNMSITASWLVLAIIAVRLIFKKTPKWIFCLLWGLVAFRLISPFSIETSLSLIPNPEPLSQETAYTSETVKQAHGEILDSEGNVIVERNPAANGDILDSKGNVIVEIQDGIRTYPEKEQTHSWMHFLSRIWLAGFGVMLAYTAVSYYLLKRKVATAIPLKRGIKQSEYVDSPFVLGIIRPVIYLPFDMAEEDKSYVIAHEKAHICRRDHWWKPLGFLLLSIYWFNPLLWVAYILLCRDIEAACDEKVIRDMDKDDRRAYSSALLNCSVHRRRIAACPLAFGEAGVKARVKSVMNYKKPAFWVILLSAVLIIFVAVTLMTDPEREYDPDKVYPQSVLQDPDRILIDVSGTDSIYEKDSVVYRRIVDAIRVNWWKYTEDNSDIAPDTELVTPIAPELLKTTSWRTYVENSDTIICFQYTSNPIIWENADGEQTSIETIAFVLPEKTWSEENTRGFFAISKTEQYGINEGIYTYYYPAEIANDFWEFIKNAKLNESTTVSGRTLSLNDVIILSQLGTDLTMNSFIGYAYKEQGDSLLYTRTYPINEEWYLLIHHGGGLEKPMSVWLTHADTGKHVDVTQGNGEGAITDFISSHNPEAAENIVCVDIWTRKHLCISSTAEVNRILSLLHDLENNVEVATKEEVASVQTDGFYYSHITVAYELGEKNITFSENFDYVWETGSDVGYRVGDPESLRQFVESVTNGVRNQEVSGKPFAAVDSPWDWCAGINTDAVESAQAHMCLNTYSYRNTSGSSSTNGWISYDTLEKLIPILNQIPEAAFTPDKTVSTESYRSFFINQWVPNSSISIVDGVNELAVVINYRDGKLTMLLTDEMEKVRENSHTYLEPTQLWTVDDQTLLAFMESITENPPVINYSVGAEYEWQDPLEFKTEGFSLELRLLEGWEYEYVTNPTDSGIRCRPEGISDGWIYFSYWPGEYEPVEEDRYIVEGGYYSWTSYTSYADKDVRIPGGMSTYGQVWSYERYDLEDGDYAVINDGADAWFAEYKDRIQDIMTLSTITVE